MYDMPAPTPPKRSGKWGGILMGVVLLFGGCSAVLKDSKDGEQAPRPTTAAEFAAAKTPGDLPSEYVSFRPDQYLSPSVSVVEGRRYKNTYSYTVVKVGNRYAVVRSVRGVAGRITARADTSEYAGAREAMKLRPDARFLPYLFDTDLGPPRTASALGGVGLLVMLGGAVVLFRSIYSGRKNAEQHGQFTEPVPVGWRWSSR